MIDQIGFVTPLDYCALAFLIKFGDKVIYMINLVSRISVHPVNTKACRKFRIGLDFQSIFECHLSLENTIHHKKAFFEEYNVAILHFY